MTPPTDSLIAALRAVPEECLERHYGEGPFTHEGCACAPDYPALAAAVREWIRDQMPVPPEHVSGLVRAWQNGYDTAVADLARRLRL